MKQQTKQLITKDTTIGDAVQQVPEAVEILIAEGIHCVGCGAANWETLEQGLAGHGKNEKEIKTMIDKINKLASEQERNPDSITITKKASKKVKELLKKDKKKDHFLRVEVISGGCSGSKYSLDFDNKHLEKDVVIKSNGVEMRVNKETLDMLKGTEIDYVDSLQGSGFKISNPNAENSCGCGDSFN
ncbi:iron-sulfur cluster assembly accessory protein [Candidatus Woesearchaeota archaeon]|jgi:iron-sulfur cluster assembly accessory protein|nr:iron-sulfur cluster assembly accessory protein [Candidatus Woesearchaeota archaeon]|tara:strand:+ start:388 stop:948 length:561 start_codon:yes stop_codon:yes gene_type:complete